MSLNYRHGKYLHGLGQVTRHCRNRGCPGCGGGAQKSVIITIKWFLQSRNIKMPCFISERPPLRCDCSPDGQAGSVGHTNRTYQGPRGSHGYISFSMHGH